MKDGWKYKPLGELCSTINGLWKGKKAPFVHVGVIRNANFTKEFTLDFSKIEYLDVEERQYKTRKLKKGDLIVEKSGGSEKQPVGRAILFNKEEGEFSFSNFTSVLRIKDSTTVTSEFLYKYILYVYQRGDTRSMQKATTGIHNIEFDKYLAIEIPVPPLSEQQRIVTYLDDAFAKIDLIKQNAEKSLSEAKALFQSALKEMMEPKEGWEEKTLGEIMNLRRGHDLTHAEMHGIKYPVAGSNGIIGTHDVATDISPCITVGRSGSVGAVNIYDKCWAHNTTLYIDDFKNNYPLYLYYVLLSLDLAHYNSGSAVPTLNRNYLHPIVVAYTPDIKRQQQIVSRLDTLSETLHELEANYTKTIAECNALKQALLRQVFE